MCCVIKTNFGQAPGCWCGSRPSTPRQAPAVHRQRHLLYSLGTAAGRAPPPPQETPTQQADWGPRCYFTVGMGDQNRVERRSRAGSGAQRSQRPLAGAPAPTALHTRLGSAPPCPAPCQGTAQRRAGSHGASGPRESHGGPSTRRQPTRQPTHPTTQPPASRASPLSRSESGGPQSPGMV